MADAIKSGFLINENHCHCLQCDPLSAGADSTHGEEICCLEQTIKSGSLEIFLVIFCSMMCGASRDLPEGVRIWTMNVYRVPACLY